MEEENTEDQPMSRKSEVWEWAKAIIIAGALVLIIRWFIFAPFIVEGASMEPNFHTGERLIVNEIIYSIRKPHHGEVVVFHSPDIGKDYIKRIIALPGDTVRVDNNKVYVNGKELDEDYIRDELAANPNYNQPGYGEHSKRFADSSTMAFNNHSFKHLNTLARTLNNFHVNF